MNLSIQTLKCQQLHARKCQQCLSNKVINDWEFQVRWLPHALLKNNLNKKKYASFQKENDLGKFMKVVEGFMGREEKEIDNMPPKVKVKKVRKAKHIHSYLFTDCS